MEIRKSPKTCKLSAIDPGDCFLAPWDHNGDNLWVRTETAYDEHCETFQCFHPSTGDLADFTEDDVQLVTAYITVE